MSKKSEQSSRMRGNNFSKEEELHLVKIITRYKHIIENRNTDQVTFRQKEEVWQKILNEFNSCNNSRSLQQLKSKYDNLKTAARKHSAKINQNHYATGGGPLDPPDSKYIIYDEIINILNKKTVVGLDNPYDDDSINIEEIPCNDSVEIMNSDVENIQIVIDEEENQNQDKQDQENIAPSTSTQFECRKSWSSYTPRMLKEPKSKKLLFRNKPAPQQEKTKTFFALKQQYIEQKIQNLKNEDERKQQKHEKEMELLDAEIVKKRRMN